MLVYVRDVPIGLAKQFNLVQIKPYYSPDVLSHTFLSDVAKGMSSFGSPKEDIVLMTEVLYPLDERAESTEMLNAREKEIHDLLKRGTFKVMLKEESLQVQTSLPGGLSS